MAHSNGRITAPVNTDDVKDTIGENSHDVGTLCLSNKINRWSKYKPVEYPSPDSVTNYWQGTDGKNGLHIDLNADNTFTNDFVRSFYNNPDNWGYVHPQGFLRLTDFDGYNHNCIPFIASRSKGQPIEKILGGTTGSGVVTVDVGVDFPRDFDNDGIPLDLTGNLTIDDFNLKDENNSSYCLKDGYLSAILAFQTNNPITHGFGGVGYDVKTAIRVNEFKLSTTAGQKLTITDFHTGFDNNTQIKDGTTLWLILGITWGYNKRLWTGIPWDNNHFYAYQYKFKNAPAVVPSFELLQWAKDPVYKGWRPIVWAMTDETVAVPATMSTFWQMKFKVSNYNTNNAIDASEVQFKNLNTGNIISPTLIDEDFTLTGNRDNYTVQPGESKVLCFNVSDLYGVTNKGDKVKLQALYHGISVWTLEFQAADNY